MPKSHMDPKVRNIVENLGYKKPEDLEPRPMVSGKVSRILESMGVTYPASEIINEQQPAQMGPAAGSPLNSPDPAPAANPQTPAMPNQQQQAKIDPNDLQGQEIPAKSPKKKPKVSLSTEVGVPQTLQEFKQKLGELTARMDTANRIIDGFMGDDTRDNKVDDSMVSALFAVINPLFETAKDLKAAVEKN